MGQRLDGNLSFDGSQSTADQYSQGVDLSRQGGREAAFVLGATFTAGKLAVTVQANYDPTGSTVEGWLDTFTSGVRVMDLSDGSLEAQTDADFTTTRTGVITATGVYLIRFTPLEARYRLRFQILAASDLTVDDILIVP